MRELNQQELLQVGGGLSNVQTLQGYLQSINAVFTSFSDWFAGLDDQRRAIVSNLMD